MTHHGYIDPKEHDTTSAIAARVERDAATIAALSAQNAALRKALDTITGAVQFSGKPDPKGLAEFMRKTALDCLLSIPAPEPASDG